VVEHTAQHDEQQQKDDIHVSPYGSTPPLGGGKAGMTLWIGPISPVSDD
jgi:hypothetical protein